MSGARVMGVAFVIAAFAAAAGADEPCQLEPVAQVTVSYTVRVDFRVR